MCGPLSWRHRDTTVLGLEGDTLGREVERVPGDSVTDYKDGP